MAPRNDFIQPGPNNFPIITNIYNFVPLPIVKFADPTVGCEKNPNSCRLVRDVTQKAPTFAENPLCFTLPDQPDITKVFIAAMRGTINWNQISCNETQPPITASYENKLGRTSYHNKIWRFVCPCAGAPRKVSTNVSTTHLPTNRSVNTVVHKDGRINIVSCNIRAVQTVTTTIQGNKKHTVVATEVTGHLSRLDNNNRQQNATAQPSFSSVAKLTMAHTKSNGTGNTQTTIHSLSKT